MTGTSKSAEAEQVYYTGNRALQTRVWTHALAIAISTHVGSV